MSKQLLFMLVDIFIMLVSILAVCIGLYAGWNEDYTKGAYFVSLAIYNFMMVKL